MQQCIKYGICVFIGNGHQISQQKKNELWKGKVLANMISGNFERRKTTATMKLVYSNGEKTQLI